MASENETVEDIGKEMRDEWAQFYFSEGTKRKDGEYSEFPTVDTNELADRFEAAYKREVASIRAKLKVAEDALSKLQDRFVSSVHDGTIDPYEALKIAETALDAIREEGGES